MKEVFLNEIIKLPYVADKGVQFNYLMGILRSVLQYSTYSAIEYTYNNLSIDEVDCDIVKQLLSPSDGAFVNVLDKFIPEIRNNFWPHCVDSWFKKTVKNIDGANVEFDSLVNRITEWVRFRNNRPAHGVVDLDTINNNIEWLYMLAEDVVYGLEDLLPIIADDQSTLSISTPNGALKLETLKIINGNSIVIRDIRNRGSVWRVRYQTLDIYKSMESFYEINESSPFIKMCLLSHSLYKSYKIELGDNIWRPTIILPQRQTTIFRGREAQLVELNNWYNDLDSRSCLIYGEGGIGKTTLVLEFFNDLIENPNSSIKWFPDVISYYSAKQTKWGPGGLEYIRGISPVIEESIRQLVTVIEDHLDRSWHAGEAKAIIDRAVTLFNDAGIKRNNILIIIDNTETLARVSTDEENLAKLFGYISSRLCRLVMTSRRYERVEARPINVPPMNDETGKELLRQLGNIYVSNPLIRAGDARLKKISRELSGRPLLLDIFARYSSYPGKSLDDSMRLVLRDTRRDLGEFLFEDAWNRIDKDHRNIFITLGQFGNPINGKVVGWICREFRLPHDLFLDAFDETRFGSLVDYGSEYDINFDGSMREFLAKKYKDLQQDKQQKMSNIANKISRQYKEYLIAQDSNITDRVAGAFKTSPAKAAKLAGKRGDIEEAIIWYEEAISVDAFNAALWDRYAWFLMAKANDLKRAKECASEAMRLDSNNQDYYFTAGMIAAKRKEVLEADKLLIHAENLGQHKYLCLIHRAKARIEASADPINDKWREYLSEADGFLKNAMNMPMDYRYEEKNLINCNRLLKRSNDVRLIRSKGI